MRKKSKFSIVLSLLAMALSATAAFAQTGSGCNRGVRTNTWSVYAQGGLSWATDVWYPDQNASEIYGLSPAFGGGVDWNIRPWVRVGAEYMYSKYRREQRFAALDPKAVPAKAYGNYHVNYHNTKLSAGFNIMEFWPTRKWQWLGIYAGTGLGYMFAEDSEYGIYFSTTMTKDGVTTPVNGTVNVENTSSVSFREEITTTYDQSRFNRLYIPVSLHLEGDISRQVSVGIKGEYDWIPNKGQRAPGSLIFVLGTARYTFGTGRRVVK